MPASASERRYASAAFTVAAQAGDYDAWLSVLNDVGRVLQMPSARTVFLSPAVPAAQKSAALDRIVPNAPRLVRNFLHILVDRDRLDQVPGIAEALRDLINVQRGIVTAEVTTAVALDAEMEQVVAQRLAQHLGREPQQITIRSRVDPSIIGGVIARVGDQVLDDSVRGRIERLRRTLAG
ncbi:MAG TPA: F0F1 ATP synthase subunit delta [Chloroflexota bacterium]